MTQRPDIRLLLSDVDGTLVTGDKVLTQEALAAVAELRRVGVAFAITSSRPARGLRMLTEPLGLVEPIAAFNGGLYVNPDLLVIDSHPIDPAAARQAVDLMLAEGLDVWVYTAKRWFVCNPAGPHVAREEWILKFAPKVLGSFTGPELARAMKIVGVCDEPARIAAAQRAVCAAVGERASVACSQTYYLDVTDRRANKGCVVETLSRLMNIAPEHIATIGDGANDVLMFRKSGFSIAMGNASDEVKSEADVATQTNEDEGFASAVRKFILSPVAA